MDFFSAQDKARQNTTRLMMLFAAAVVALIVLTNLLVMLVMGLYNSTINNGALTGGYIQRIEQGQSGTAMLKGMYWDAFLQAFDWRIFFMVGVAVSVIVLLGSLYKVMSLSAGGKAVAELLGGRRVSQNTDDADERKLLNVVEEMAIASGTPMPTVYILAEENGINAFAAGYTPGDAVIGVTRGCVRYLNRDQLQGVIAHEFSHIVNGDMRLNIRLMGVLYGILLIGMVGYYLLRSARFSGRRNNAAAGMLTLGLGLMVIGFAGSFFGSLIKASVSRQREYLADASAVQFTRNPDGIAGALKKIGGFQYGSQVTNPAAPEISHAFFATGVKSFFTDLFATHPPLDQRIRAIDPAWDGKFHRLSVGDMERGREQQPLAAAPVASGSHAAPATAAMVHMIAAVDAIGRPSMPHLGYARQLLQVLPATVYDAVHEPYTARAVIYALVLNKDTATRDKQLQHLSGYGDAGVYETTLRLLPQVQALGDRFRLPLIDAAAAALRDLSPLQYQRFKKNLLALIAADNRISLFEWALQKNLLHHLDANFNKQPIMASAGRYASLEPVLNECVLVLSVLAHAEHRSTEDVARAFKAGAEMLRHPGLQILPKDSLSVAGLNDAFDALVGLKPLVIPQFLKACVATITADGKVSVAETELLRAFSAILDCPMPPLLEYAKG